MTEPATSLVQALRARGLWVATAESVTGGLLCADLVSVPGASECVRGGLVAYSTEVKVAGLGVDPEALERFGAVSEPVSEQMAVGALDRFDADLALSTTGVAGPGPHDGVPAGTFWIGLARPERVHAVAFRAAGDRETVRRAAVREGLKMAMDALAPQ